MANNGEVSFNVTKSIWRLNNVTNGWQKEVNLVAWNSNKPRLDIRDWNTDKTKMKKGITLSKDEAIELRKCLNTLDLDFLYDDTNTSVEVRTGPGPADTGATFVIASTCEKKTQTEEEPEIISEDGDENVI